MIGYDKKIDDRCMILNCLDIEFAKDRYKDSSGYFTDYINNYSDLTLCTYGKLTDIKDSGYHVYQKDNGENFAFFLPDSAIKKEKKYRPYTIEEFCNEGFEIVVFREKNRPSHESHVRYNGYRKYDNVYKVILGNISYLLDDLFEDFEYLDSDGDWKPFGVEE